MPSPSQLSGARPLWDDESKPSNGEALVTGLKCDLSYLTWDPLKVLGSCEQLKFLSARFWQTPWGAI